MNNPRILFLLFVNVVGSVGLVLLNKYLNETGFTYVTTLTVIHFLLNTLLECLCALLNIFRAKRLSIWKMLPLSLSFSAAVVFMNLNLRFNTVSFYQLSKLLCIPCMLVLQRLMHGVKTTLETQVVLAVLCIGVGVGTVTDLSATVSGTFVAAIAMLSTSLYQIWASTKQKELSANSMQLLLYQAPLSCLFLIPTCPLLDNYGDGPGSIFLFEWTNTSMLLISVSALLSFSANVSTYLIIGKTSPVSYQVVGNLKTCSTMILGSWYFHRPMSWQTVAGIVVAFVAIFYYSYIKIRDSSPPTKKD